MPFRISLIGGLSQGHWGQCDSVETAKALELGVQISALVLILSVTVGGPFTSLTSWPQSPHLENGNPDTHLTRTCSCTKVNIGTGPALGECLLNSIIKPKVTTQVLTFSFFPALSLYSKSWKSKWNVMGEGERPLPWRVKDRMEKWQKPGELTWEKWLREEPTPKAQTRKEKPGEMGNGSQIIGKEHL